MSSDLSVQNKQNRYVDSSQSTTDSSRIGNTLTNGTTGASYVASTESTETTDIEGLKKQQENVKQQMIDKALNEIIKGTNLTLDEVKKMLEVFSKGKITDDITKLKHVLECLKFAIKDSTENGKVDKDKLKNVFGCYVLLSMKSKNKMSCEQIHALLNMSLVELLKAKNPSLKNKKNITAQDIADTIKPMIDGQLSEVKLKQFPKPAKELLRSMFATGLAKCTPEEMELLTEAFIILFKDKDLSDEVHIIVSEVCNSLKDKPEKLNQFINTTLVQILKKHNFSDESIQRIITSSLGDFLAKNPDKLEILLQAGIDFLASLKDSEDLPILLKVLDAQLKGNLDSLNDKEIAVLNKYKDQISNLIQVYAQIANNPDLANRFNEKLDKLNKQINESGLNDYIFNYLKQMYENNPDIFNNVDSQDDLAKILNKATDNKYSESVGDTNPDNLYKGETESGFGMSQRVSSEGYWSALARQNEYTVTINEASKSTEPQYVVLPNNTNKVEIITPWKKYQSIKNLSAKELYSGLTKNYIKIDDILDNYKDLSHSAKLFVNKLIEIMSPAEQNFRLDGMPNRAAIDIIKHSNINPEDLKLSLDFASQKELEKMEEEKAEF